MLISVLSVLLIIGASEASFTSRLLSLPPLTFLGRISYSLYLVHFPVLIFVIWWNLAPSFHQWLAAILSVLLAIAMYVCVEKPFRERRFSPRFNVSAALSLILVFIVLQVTIRSNPAIAAGDLAKVRNELASITGTDSNAVSEIPRIAIFGDSTAVAMSLGLESVRGSFNFVGGYAELGCPIGEGGLRRGLAAHGDRSSDIAWPVEDICARHHWIETARSLAPIDVAIILSGNWDTVGRHIEQLGDGFFTINDADKSIPIC